MIGGEKSFSGVACLEVADWIIASGYGARMNIRKVTSSIEKVEKKARYGYEITADMVINATGGKKARKKLKEGGFYFNVGKNLWDFREVELGILLDSVGYSRKDVREALIVHCDGDISLDSATLNREIEKMTETVVAFANGGCNGECSYDALDASKKALRRLMFAWKNQQASLF